MKNNNDKKNSIIAWIVIVLIVCGIYGMHSDWTMYVLEVPVWAVVGMLVDLLINGKNSSHETVFVSIMCVLILTNVSLLLVHRDTQFVVGRLLCTLGATIGIIRTAGNIAEKK